MSTDYTQGAAWIRGNILPIAEATIGVTDWALTHSDVTYDVVPVWEGAFFRLPDYLDRFEASMRACRMDVGLSRPQIETALHAMVARSGLRAAYCAMVAARGSPLIPGSRDPRDCANHFYAWCVPYVHVLKPEVAEAGAKLLLPDDIRRIPEDSVDPRAKNYHWGDFTQGLFAAKDHGLDNVVLADHAGNVTEGPGFNIFALKGETVITPDRGVLQGITRRTVLDLAREAGLRTEERPLPVAELMQADEVFLSTSGGGVVPVAQINERSFSNGRPGPMGAALRKRYFDRLADPAFRTDITYDTA
ncbi:branched-chain amino acid--2-keto-4-methylthiobutyrate aminotransferase [Roseovarius sp. HI0049]|nr:branched-chain amino acid--2-keto-4-methylthiobutyrate aminotransferase [Roseovarius sp. HI0049]